MPRRSDYLPVDSAEELSEYQPEPEPARFRVLLAVALVLCIATTPAAAAHLVYSRPRSVPSARGVVCTACEAEATCLRSLVLAFTCNGSAPTFRAFRVALVLLPRVA